MPVDSRSSLENGEGSAVVFINHPIAIAVDRTSRTEAWKFITIDNGKEGVGKLEDHILERGVDYHRDRTAGGEQVADIRKSDIRSTRDSEGASKTKVLSVSNSSLNHQKSGGLTKVDRGFPCSERERGRDKEFEARWAEAQVEATFETHQVRAGSGRTDAGEADHLDRKEPRG